jgi:hypothetical protein
MEKMESLIASQLHCGGSILFVSLLYINSMISA